MGAEERGHDERGLDLLGHHGEVWPEAVRRLSLMLQGGGGAGFEELHFLVCRLWAAITLQAQKCDR